MVAASFGLATIFSGCKTSEPNSPTTDEGVVINGVKWATRNVDKPYTFASAPESYGKFYQWNRKIAWPTEGEITGWNEIPAEGESWESANDPSPAGWRVPTFEEIQTLLDTEKVSSQWVIFSGVEGRVFIDVASGNSIFLPAAGWRYTYNGKKYDETAVGAYWSGTTPYDNPTQFAFSISFIDWSFGFRHTGQSVRPVAK